MADPKKKDDFEQIAKIAKAMTQDKEISEKNRGQADRILGIAEGSLAAMGEAKKSEEGG